MTGNERYVVGQDFNTKDWYIYDNVSNTNIYRFDTEEEAKAWVNLQSNPKWISCELPRDKADDFKQYCKTAHIKYEASECFNLIHFECLVNADEMKKANDFIDTL